MRFSTPFSFSLPLFRLPLELELERPECNLESDGFRSETGGRVNAGEGGFPSLSNERGVIKSSSAYTSPLLKFDEMGGSERYKDEVRLADVLCGEGLALGRPTVVTPLMERMVGGCGVGIWDFDSKRERVFWKMDEGVGFELSLGVRGWIVAKELVVIGRRGRRLGELVGSVSVF